MSYLLGLAMTAEAAVTITTLNSAWTEDFNSFNASGFVASPTAGQLDSDDWRLTGMSDGDGTFGGSFNSGDFARGTSDGDVGTGGVYAFEPTTGDFIFGFQPAGSDVTPGTLTLAITNNSGTTATGFEVSYDIFTFNDEDRANSLNFAYSIDDSSYIQVPALDFTTPEAASGTAEWVSVPKSTGTISLSIPSESTFYLQFQTDDVSGGGSRDEFGIDNLSVTVVPEPSTYVAVLGVFALGLVAYRRRKNRS